MKDKIKIVIADDSHDICQTWKDILTEKGYAVETVNNGYEILACLKEDPPHIIVLDLMMPEKGGIEIFATIKALSPNTKIIIYTGFKKYEDSPYARMADKFLLKDNDPGKLLQAISEIAQIK